MLKVTNIQCQYDHQPVLKDISFQVGKGEICALLGPSGCGKTTILRAIAGFHSPSKGSISLDDKILNNNHITVAPELRQIGMVFQDYALFPHLTVQENIAFGITKLKKQQQQQIIDTLISLIKLEDTTRRYPHELSGGQQQRVALARALAPNPKLLLLDEPFSNLDIGLRRHLNIEVKEILKQYGTSAILVTHDQEEAFAFGDKIGLINEGHLQQWDTPFNLYHHPKNRFVANFIAQGYLIPGTIIDANSISTELGILTDKRRHNWREKGSVDVLLRPSDLALSDSHGINVKVLRSIFSGNSTLCTLQLPSGSLLEALLPSHRDYPIGDSLKIKATVSDLTAFSNDEPPSKNS